ncbi:MAG: hypothetical protein Q4G34_01690 [Micrococcus sp.]|nr:hypothetical protein [Micrococcus sp.]
MSLTTVHLRLGLAAAGICGALVGLSLLWGDRLPASLSSVQITVLTVAVGVATLMPLLGAVLPATNIQRPASAVLPALGLFGFATLLTGQLDLFPVRIVVILGLAISAGCVLAALFAGQESSGAPRATARRFE